MLETLLRLAVVRDREGEGETTHMSDEDLRRMIRQLSWRIDKLEDELQALKKDKDEKQREKKE
jgi:uncharacterized membrane protein YukC